jgi:hypothetical protein
MKSIRKILSVQEALSKLVKSGQEGCIVDGMQQFTPRGRYRAVVDCRDYITGEQFQVGIEHGVIGDTQTEIAADSFNRDVLWTPGNTSVLGLVVARIEDADPKVIGLNVTSGGLRYDDGKTPYDILSPISLEGTALILELGAVKYELRNWEKGMAWSRVIGPTFRHLVKFVAGEDLDQETGMPHVHHIACNVMFLQHYFELGLGQDDRAKLGDGVIGNLRLKYRGAMDAFKDKWKRKQNG